MNNEQILMCVVALVLGMLLANMLKSVCDCKVVEGQGGDPVRRGGRCYTDVNNTLYELECAPGLECQCPPDNWSPFCMHKYKRCY